MTSATTDRCTTKPVIRAGTMAELASPRGHWVFVDIGFASSKTRSTGYLQYDDIGAAEPIVAEQFTFSDAKSRVIQLAESDGDPLHLVIEAPLSTAFDDAGNPIGRTVEQREEDSPRYWHLRGAAGILVASLFLLRDLRDASRRREVRLFEGFCSFKGKSTDSGKTLKPGSSHLDDAVALARVVRSAGKDGGQFREPRSLNELNAPVPVGVFALLGGDTTPPPIVEVV